MCQTRRKPSAKSNLQSLITFLLYWLLNDSRQFAWKLAELAALLHYCLKENLPVKIATRSNDESQFMNTLRNALILLYILFCCFIFKKTPCSKQQHVMSGSSAKLPQKKKDDTTTNSCIAPTYSTKMEYDMTGLKVNDCRLSQCYSYDHTKKSTDSPSVQTTLPLHVSLIYSVPSKSLHDETYNCQNLT